MNMNMHVYRVTEKQGFWKPRRAGRAIRMAPHG